MRNHHPSPREGAGFPENHPSHKRGTHTQMFRGNKDNRDDVVTANADGSVLVGTSFEMRDLTPGDGVDDAFMIKDPRDGRRHLVITAEHAVDLADMS